MLSRISSPKSSIIRLQGNASYLFENLTSFLGGIQKALPSVKRVSEIYDLETEIPRHNRISQTVTDQRNSNEILKIHNLNFCYDGSGNVLNKLSLSINRYDFICIMGESGKRKTTLAKILSGLYYPEADALIQNQDYRPSVFSIHEQVAYVDQNCHLFQLSIAENVRLGNPGASQADIIKACKAAQAHDFIMNLKHNYNTVINKTCDNISGGQRQRIAIARAIISSRELLLIAEGTAELDRETESIVNETILGLKGKKTIIMITHKSSLINSADKRFLLIDGNLRRVRD